MTHKFNRKFLILLLALIAALGLVNICSAGNVADYYKGYVNQFTEPIQDISSSDRSLGDIVADFILNITGLVAVVFALLFIWAGGRYLFSQGKKEEIQKARMLMRNALIGLIIFVLAYALTYTIISFFGSVYNSKNGESNLPMISENIGYVFDK